jgi:TrmH family RNA methyltransferase
MYWMNKITSIHNEWMKRVRLLSRRNKRDIEHAFILEGFRLLMEAAVSGIRFERILVDETEMSRAELQKIPQELIISVASGLLARITQLRVSPGVIAIAHMPKADKGILENASFIAATVGLSDPGNLGTVIRTADAVGMEAILLSSSVDPYNLKVLRGSMGSVFHLPILQYEDAIRLINDLRHCGLQAVAADISGSVQLYEADLTGRIALFVGAEAAGLPDELLRLMDMTVRVPMSTRVESLNAATAFSVIAYEIYRQKIDFQA